MQHNVCSECDDLGTVYAGCHHCDSGVLHSKCDSYYRPCSKVVVTNHIAMSGDNHPLCGRRHEMGKVHERHPVQIWPRRKEFLKRSDVCQMCKNEAEKEEKRISDILKV